jgi:hypothetical protein
MENIQYKKYEEYSTRYVLDPCQLHQWSQICQNEEEMDQMIATNCYYNLITRMTDDFIHKLEHNVHLATRNHDDCYLQYLQNKWNLPQISTGENWIYCPKKLSIIIKLKDPLQPSEPLIKILGLDPSKTYQSRSDLIKLVHQYIYQNRLQSRIDRKVINPNTELTQFLLPLNAGVANYTYENLPNYIP